MRYVHLALSGALWLGGLVVMLVPAAGAVPVGVGTEVWSDEFNGTAVDPTKWAINAPGVWEDATNSSKAVSVSGGNLKINTYTDPSTGKNYCAVLGTQNLFLTTYGYFEARIQFNGAPGTWSAFWLMSPTVGNPMNNPAVAGTEIDVAEHRSVDDTGADVSSRINTAIHWDGYGSAEQSLSKLSAPLPGMSNGSWHTYGLNWTPDGYTFYVDDTPIRTVTSAVSQRSEYLLLSSEVQDGSWAGNIPAGGYGASDVSTSNMLVDYVRVYAVPEPAGALALLLPLAARAATRRRSPERRAFHQQRTISN